MDLEKLFGLAWSQRRQVVTFGLVTGLLVFLIGLFIVTYEASGTLLVKPLGLDTRTDLASMSPLVREAITPRVGLVYSPQLALAESHGTSYVEFVTSRPVLEDVVRELGLESAYTRSGGMLGGLLELIKKPARLIVYGGPPAVEQTPFERAVMRLRLDLNVRFMANSSILEITTYHTDAQLAADIVSTLMDAVTTRSSEITAGQLDSTAQFVAGQLTELRTEVVARQEMLDDLKAQFGLDRFDTVGAEEARVSTRLTAARTQFENIDFRRDQLEQTLVRIDASLEAYPQYTRFATTVAVNPEYTALRAQLRQLRLSRNQLLFDYVETSPEVLLIDGQIAAVIAQLETETERMVTAEDERVNPVFQSLLTRRATVEDELNGIPELRDRLRRRIDSDSARLDQLQQATQEFRQIDLRIGSLSAQESQLATALQEVELLAASAPSEVAIFQRPVIPRYPGIRDMPLLIFVLTGMIAGSGLAVLRLAWRHRND